MTVDLNGLERLILATELVEGKETPVYYSCCGYVNTNPGLEEQWVSSYSGQKVSNTNIQDKIIKEFVRYK
jgi:hypothetical protein